LQEKSKPKDPSFFEMYEERKYQGYLFIYLFVFISVYFIFFLIFEIGTFPKINSTTNLNSVDQNSFPDLFPHPLIEYLLPKVRKTTGFL
jgi:hypothetical protein